MRMKMRVSESGVQELGLKLKRRQRSMKPQAFGVRWRRIAAEELRAYFSGRLRSFTVPCDLSGLPPFTQAVLGVTAAIPYGEVRSYRWVAERLGKPGATRAVGNALARNPIPIIIPCHRVVRSDGKVGGFALGTHWKKRLLEVEKAPVKKVDSQRSR